MPVWIVEVQRALLLAGRHTEVWSVVCGKKELPGGMVAFCSYRIISSCMALQVW